MKKELHIFLTAVMFYTRIPVPRWVDHSAAYLNESSRYFSLIGWIVGGAAAFIFFLAHLIFPAGIAVLLSMVFSLGLTGGFHEDGLADTADGFGGGWTPQRILEIMKDSRVGTYGVLALIMALSIKWQSLAETLPLTAGILWAGHSVSRWGPIWVMYGWDYARMDEKISKSKPVARRPKVRDMFISGFWAIFPLFFLGTAWFLLGWVPVLATALLMGSYFHKRISGYTGDCLGAVQQVGEIVFYLFALGLMRV